MKISKAEWKRWHKKAEGWPSTKLVGVNATIMLSLSQIYNDMIKYIVLRDYERPTVAELTRVLHRGKLSDRELCGIATRRAMEDAGEKAPWTTPQEGFAWGMKNPKLVNKWMKRLKKERDKPCGSTSKS